MLNLSKIKKLESRSISPENFSGEKGKGGMAEQGTGAEAARDLGRGWKISPSIRLEPGETFTLADIKGDIVHGLEHGGFQEAGGNGEVLFQMADLHQIFRAGGKGFFFTHDPPPPPYPPRGVLHSRRRF